MNLKNKNTILLILTIFLLISFKTGAQDIIINEIMSSNQETIQDEDFDFNDWFELKNISEKKLIYQDIIFLIIQINQPAGSLIQIKIL